MSRSLKYIDFLSLDVVAGAVLMTLSISKILQVELPISITICLGISIWTIYTLDHLLDAFRANQKPTIARHLFHKENARWIIPVWLLVVLFGAYTALSLPAVTFLYGIGMVLTVLIYFTLIYFFRTFYFKEVVVAIVYSCGIFVGPMSLLHGSISTNSLVLLLEVFLLALVNLILFSRFESKFDDHDKHPSIVLALGAVQTQKLLDGLFLTIGVVQCYFLISNYNIQSLAYFQGLFIVMALVLFSMKTCPSFFTKNDRYRLIGDGIFFIPALVLL
ncbi:MAG: hypothetical protein JXQ96_04220 [Cyclobacteriaceae bacterium]